MDLTEAMTVRANGHAALAALVGDHIHWLARPQGEALPALVLQVISDSDAQDLDGEVGIMRTARVQADSMAKTYVAARDAAYAAMAALLPVAEVSGDAGGIAFWQGSADGPRDLGEPTETGFVHRASVDLIIRYCRI